MRREGMSVCSQFYNNGPITQALTAHSYQQTANNTGHTQSDPQARSPASDMAARVYAEPPCCSHTGDMMDAINRESGEC